MSSTISRVINKKKYVNETTKQLVLDAIDRLDYVPNELARSLFRKQSRIIGIIVPHLTSYYFGDLLEVIEDSTINHNYRLMICNSQDNKEREAKYLQVFHQYNIDGIIMISNTTRIQDYQSLSIPIIAIDHKLTEDIPSVTSNNYLGGKLAAEKLVSCGCKKIIHFRGPSVLLTVQDRTSGFKSVLEKNNIYNFSFDLDFKSPSGEDIENVINANLDCDGIFCDSDIMALYAIQSLKKNGRRVPEDVQVIGFDNIELSNIISPKLSTIAQSAAKIGSYAVETLIRLIDGKPIEEYHRQIDVTLIERETTKHQ
ncbi:MAG TPA: LacI family DNA-binding transcriptional regulator [Bacillota bacterium]|nr:LacI family DNA-binding transcriptional regulator [Bacillota bacterium]